ncbi:MAG: CARDB domain-containing protein, partial [Candidatus Binatia bacterium]
MQTDCYGNIPESNESNNGLVAPFTVTKADLVVTALTPPASVVAGSSMSVPTTVQNQGDGQTPSGSWVECFWLSADAILDGGDTQLAVPAHSGVVAAGGSYTVTHSIGISGATTP